MDWWRRQSSLNGFQAKCDSDGVFRCVISSQDPGVHNWLDTAGYSQLTIMGRWLHARDFPQPQIKVIPFGINTDYFKPDKSKKANTLTIGTVKHFKTIYGIETLIKAVAQLAENGQLTNYRLLLIGDGPQKQNYIRLAKQLGIEDKIEFTGFIINNQLASYYQQMDIVVIPSLRESFGISVLEGMSCEKPVIASDISGFNEVGTPETITYFKAGDPNELANKIIDCIQNGTTYKLKAQKARERVVALFSEKSCVEKKKC